MLYFLLLLCTVNLLSIDTEATDVINNDDEQSGMIPTSIYISYSSTILTCSVVWLIARTCK